MRKRSQLIMIALLIMALNTGSGEGAQKMDYTFELSNDVDLMMGTSRIISMVEIGPDMSEDSVKVQGQLLTLFGEPVYTTKDLENAYAYVIVAKTGGKEFVLTAYRGPSGPAIGGDRGIDGILEAAEKLKEYILAAQPSDYEYEGYYFDAPTKIHQGMKDGRVFFSETVMSQEEWDRAYHELYPRQQ